ncbi:unnamed protein product [Calypogeia fissa]
MCSDKTMGDDLSTILVTGAVLISITILILIAIKAIKVFRDRYRLRRQMQCQTSPRPLTTLQSTLANGTSPVQTSQTNGTRPEIPPSLPPISANV